ncbi:MAG: flagellar basal-body MS-ring/collar protein FliF [Myxococcota bacterium]
MTRKLAVILGAAALVGAGVFGFSQVTQPSMGVLFSNLAQDDAARVVERLKALNLPYKLAGGGNTVLIQEDQIHETRLTLAAEGIPRGGNVGFELFDEQRFGESEFSEQVKYHRALEGELARTISSVSGVDSARVHLVLPERSVFTSADTPASASIALQLRPGWQMREDQVRGIVHLVASSVRGLEDESVIIVDGEGRNLTSERNAEEEGTTDALAYRKRVEQAKQRAVQEILDATLGPGRAVVRVAAEVDFSRQEVMEERYDPQASATRSFQIEEETDGTLTREAAGIPGAATNLPGGDPAQSNVERGGTRRRTETRNFEPSKTVRRTARPIGRIQRLTVAIMVDGTWEDGEDESRSFTPRSEDELQRIQSIAGSAVGADADRGDTVTVQCMPFASSENPEPEVVDPLAPLDPYRPLFKPIGYAVLGLVGLIMLMSWRRGFKKRQKERRAQAERERALSTGEVPPPVLTQPTSVRDLEASIKSESAKAALQSGDPGRDEEATELRLLAATLASEDPQRAARVLRGWLAEERSR